MEQNHLFTDNKGKIRQADPQDYERVAGFLTQNIRIHRHLDWFTALEWLGEQPFLLETNENQILAMLCAAKENPETSWIRAFGIRKTIPNKIHWQRLLSKAIQNLRETGTHEMASLAIEPWYEDLLTTSGFSHQQDVVVLELDKHLMPSKRSRMFRIRSMQPEDLRRVQEIDRLAFPPLWQNSLNALGKAYQQNGIATVAEDNDNIVGYQISTTMTIYGHLARLAVHPDFQRQGIAYALVSDLMQSFDNLEMWRVTVNTQSDNLASLNLYHSLGFKLTGEKIPVFTLSLD